jgi:hypothetical protein
MLAEIITDLWHPIRLATELPVPLSPCQQICESQRMRATHERPTSHSTIIIVKYYIPMPIIFNGFHAFGNKLHFWNKTNEICEEWKIWHNDRFHYIHTSFLVLLGGCLLLPGKDFFSCGLACDSQKARVSSVSRRLVSVPAFFMVLLSLSSRLCQLLSRSLPMNY